MPSTKEQQETLTGMLAQVQLHLDSAADGAMQEDVFTQYLIDELEQMDEGPGGHAFIVHEDKAGSCSGWHYDEDTQTLFLYVSIFHRQSSVVDVGLPKIRDALNRSIRLLEKCDKGFHLDKEPAAPVFTLGNDLKAMPNDLNLVIILLTDGLAARVPDNEEFKFRGRKVSWRLWDIAGIDRLFRNGRVSGPIEIDFCEEDLGGKPMTLLSAPWQDEAYDAYVGIMPAWVLGKIYRRHGSRLMERNVRAYLDAKGKVNKGILKTMTDEPGRFLAYNNGLCVTASRLEGEHVGDNIFHVRRIIGLQIVNGGQTTASIARANCDASEQMGRASVQMKLSVIKDPGAQDEIVSRISLYANSQNKVTESDFASNEPYHVAMEKQSRSVWAPAVGDGARQTKWFYERARGSYHVELSRRRTDREKNEFSREYPKSQWFAKTDLAKYEMICAQMPFIACQGGQKCFLMFKRRMSGLDERHVDAQFFQQTIARAIIYRQAYAIIKEVPHGDILGFGNLRSQVTAYTLAWIIHHVGSRVDLNAIWQSQVIDNRIASLLPAVSRKVHDFIIQGTNYPSERCKREQCWDDLKASDLGLDPASLRSLERLQTAPVVSNQTMEVVGPGESEVIERVHALGFQKTLTLAAWGKETNSLQYWQIKIAESVAMRLGKGQRPSYKQAVQVDKMLEKAVSMGFNHQGQAAEG